MSKIYQAPISLIGTTQVEPNFKFMVVGDNYSTVTGAGYLNQISLEGNPISSTDIIQALYNFDLSTQSGIYGVFTVSISNGIITLALANATTYVLSSGVTTTYAGGGTSNAFTISGVTTLSRPMMSILTSTNSVSITKIVPTTNTLTVTFSADPGAGTTLSYLIYT